KTNSPGGTITISQTGSGGILLGDVGPPFSLINAVGASGGGDGGSITINTGTGGLTIADTSGKPILFQADAILGAGGTVTLNMASFNTVAGSGNLLITARGASDNGGKVTVNLTNACQDLIIGNLSGEIQIVATGGDPGSIAGDGGTVTL